MTCLLRRILASLATLLVASTAVAAPRVAPAPVTPPRVGEPLPWPTVKTWLDDAPVASGCVELIAGSHRGGLATPAGGTIPAALIDERAAVTVPAAAGDVVLLHNLVWHRSRRNHTAQPRRALRRVAGCGRRRR